MSTIDKQLGTWDTNELLDTKLEEFAKGKRDAFKSRLDNWFSDVFDTHYNALEDNLPIVISAVATARAKEFFKRILAGNTDAGEALFDSGEQSRKHCCGLNPDDPWSRIIRGDMHETEAIKLRKRMVEAHADLLRTEAIKDLESQVEAVTKQLSKANRRLEMNGLSPEDI